MPQSRQARLDARRAKLFGKMRDYGIDPKLSDCWFKLAAVQDALLDKAEQERKRGAGRAKHDDAELVRLVDQYFAEHPRHKFKDADRHLKKLDPVKWKGNRLDRHYRDEVRRAQKEAEKQKREREVRPVVAAILKKLDAD